MPLKNLNYESFAAELENLRQQYGDTVLNRELVHKENEDNVFIRQVKCIESSEERDSIITLFHFPLDHAYFFEHHKDHIPGLMLIEAGRQSGTAVCHQVYKVPLGHVFILDEVVVRFLRLARPSSSLEAFNYITDKKFRKEKLVSLVAEGYFFQHGEKVAYMKSCWKVVDPGLFNRMNKQ